MTSLVTVPSVAMISTEALIVVLSLRAARMAVMMLCSLLLEALEISDTRTHRRGGIVWLFTGIS